MRWWVVVSCALAVLLVAQPARAQLGAEIGIRAGAGADPDQFFFGVHTETRRLTPRLTFRPNVEVGVGDDLTLVALNLEFAWWIAMAGRPLSLYVGAGPAANAYSTGGRGNSDGGVSGGLNFLVGVQHRDGLFSELKVGAIDSPSVKFTVGYVFGR